MLWLWWASWSVAIAERLSWLTPKLRPRQAKQIKSKGDHSCEPRTRFPRQIVVMSPVALRCAVTGSPLRGRVPLPVRLGAALEWGGHFTTPHRGLLSTGQGPVQNHHPSCSFCRFAENLSWHRDARLCFLHPLFYHPTVKPDPVELVLPFKIGVGSEVGGSLVSNLQCGWDSVRLVLVLRIFLFLTPLFLC